MAKKGPEISRTHDVSEKANQSAQPLNLADLKVRKEDLRGGPILEGEGILVRAERLEGRKLFLPVKRTHANPKQPRRFFNPVKMRELGDSMEIAGQLNPVQVVPCLPKGAGELDFFLIDGERRVRIVEEKGEEFIVGTVEWEPTERAIQKRSAILNVRENNNPLELGACYAEFVKWEMEEKDIGKTEATENVAKEMSVSVPTIINYVRLLSLDKSIQDLVMEGKLPTYGALLISSAKLKFGDKLNEAMVARLILENPEADAVGRGRRKAGQYSEDGINARIREALMSGGEVTEDEAKELRVAQNIVKFVGSVRGMVGRCTALLDPDARETVVKVMRERRGDPPEKVFENLMKLRDGLEKVFKEVIKPAMEPPALEIPHGAPTFAEQIGRRKSVFSSDLRFAMAQCLAAASDDGGKVLTATQLQQLVAQKNGDASADITTITNNLRYIDSELAGCNLLLDTHVVRRREQAGQGSFEKVNAYRVKWLPNAFPAEKGKSQKAVAKPRVNA